MSDSQRHALKRYGYTAGAPRQISLYTKLLLLSPPCQVTAYEQSKDRDVVETRRAPSPTSGTSGIVAATSQKCINRSQLRCTIAQGTGWQGILRGSLTETSHLAQQLRVPRKKGILLLVRQRPAPTHVAIERTLISNAFTRSLSEVNFLVLHVI